MAAAAQSSAPQSKLVVFGDSLSDNGNLFGLTGLPPKPYWQGRFSNGPTYAETLAAIVAADAVTTTIYAYGGAEAAGSRPIDLDAQVAQYFASLAGMSAAGTTAILNIGNNDYLNYDPASGEVPPVADVIGNIRDAAIALAQGGVEKIVLVTLPDIGVTPRGAALAAIDPNLVAGAHQIIEANNAGLKQLAAGLDASGIDTVVVDINRLAWEVFNDGTTFGFKTKGFVLGGALTTFAPNEVAFFDDIHPTYAFHGVAAAFFAASLEADRIQFFDDGNNAAWGFAGRDLIFTGKGNDFISVGAGNDIAFAGSGNDFVLGGDGNDLLAGGSGNDALFGNSGADILADNSGNNALDGGAGDDLLIINRLGSSFVSAGTGNDLIIVKNDPGTFGFESIFGGSGLDTLRFVAAPRSAQALQQELDQFNAFATNFLAHPSASVAQGIALTGIERVELQIDTYDPLDPLTPYLITHTVTASVGAGGSVSTSMSEMLKTAELWGLMTV